MVRSIRRMVSLAIIIMIELALAWQAMAGVMINAMTITILHVLSRISMVLLDRSISTAQAV